MLGGSPIGGAFLGNDKVQKIYMGNELVYSCGYDAYNIVVREGYKIVLYDTDGIKLNEVVGNQVFRMTADNHYVYALCGDDTDYHIKLYDFLLNEVDSILLPGMNTPTNYQYDLIVASGKKVMFHSINSGGGLAHRMGFIDLNKSKEVHYVDVNVTGSSCKRAEIFYDETTDRFYSRTGSTVIKLNEDTYEWEDTGYANFISINPCSRVSWDVSFINGLGNAICSGAASGNVVNLTYVYNNREGVVAYKNENDLPLWYHVMLDEETPFAYTVDNNSYVEIGTITDLMNPTVVTKKLDIRTNRNGIFPMYKHPYKNIILIPVSNDAIPKICVYNYETETYSIINCTYATPATFSCNAVTVPKH